MVCQRTKQYIIVVVLIVIIAVNDSLQAIWFVKERSNIVVLKQNGSIQLLYCIKSMRTLYNHEVSEIRK